MVLEDFDAVVRLYRPRVFRFLLASSQDRDVAETLTQECFLKAFRARESYRGEASLLTWLMQIATNLQRDHWRDRKLQFWRKAHTATVQLEDASEWIPDGQRSAESVLLAREQLKKVLQVVEDLSPKQRMVFLLRFVEEMELHDIATATGMKEGTLKVHLSRAVRAVRERMGKRR